MNPLGSCERAATAENSLVLRVSARLSPISPNFRTTLALLSRAGRNPNDSRNLPRQQRADTFVASGSRRLVRGALSEAIGGDFGNPSSDHRSSEKPRRAITHARDCIAGLLNARADQLCFGSGVTELNYWVISDLIGKRRLAHLVTTEVEHSCVLDTAAFPDSEGVRVTWLPVDRSGLLDVPWYIPMGMEARPSNPEQLTTAATRAFDAGADGVLASREYA